MTPSLSFNQLSALLWGVSRKLAAVHCVYRDQVTAKLKAAEKQLGSGATQEEYALYEDQCWAEMERQLDEAKTGVPPASYRSLVAKHKQAMSTLGDGEPSPSSLTLALELAAILDCPVPVEEAGSHILTFEAQVPGKHSSLKQVGVRVKVPDTGHIKIQAWSVQSLAAEPGRTPRETHLFGTLQVQASRLGGEPGLTRLLSDSTVQILMPGQGPLSATLKSVTAARPA